VRKSPTGGKGGKESDGCDEEREDTVLERIDSGNWLDLASDHLL
jgi:hypothetical protein